MPARVPPPPSRALWPYQVLLRVRPTVIGVLLKRLFRIKRREVRTHRGTFFIDPASHLGITLLRDGEYEPGMVAVLESRLKPGSVFVDVGANEGYLSVIAARLVGPSGRVLAVEPQRRLRAVLERNLSLNHLRNVMLVDSAVSDRVGRVRLFVSLDTNTGATGLTSQTRYPVPSEIVRTTTLSELFARSGIRQADLLKIDIEGAEYEAVLGSPELFEQHRVLAVALELHEHLLNKRVLASGPILDLLRRCGYKSRPEFTNLVLTAPEP